MAAKEAEPAAKAPEMPEMVIEKAPKIDSLTDALNHSDLKASIRLFTELYPDDNTAPYELFYNSISHSRFYLTDDLHIQKEIKQVEDELLSDPTFKATVNTYCIFAWLFRHIDKELSNEYLEYAYELDPYSFICNNFMYLLLTNNTEDMDYFSNYIINYCTNHDVLYFILYNIMNKEGIEKAEKVLKILESRFSSDELTNIRHALITNKFKDDDYKEAVKTVNPKRLYLFELAEYLSLKDKPTEDELNLLFDSNFAIAITYYGCQKYYNKRIYNDDSKKIYEKAADLGYFTANSMLGDWYNNKHDYVNALVNYKIAADAGLTYAANRIVLYYTIRHIVDYDRDIVNHYAIQACKDYHIDRLINLAIVLDIYPSIINRSFTLYKRVVDLGRFNVKLKIAMNFYVHNKFMRNYDKARELVKEVQDDADAGDADREECLATFHAIDWAEKEHNRPYVQ